MPVQDIAVRYVVIRNDYPVMSYELTMESNIVMFNLNDAIRELPKTCNIRVGKHRVPFICFFFLSNSSMSSVDSIMVADYCIPQHFYLVRILAYLHKRIYIVLYRKSAISILIVLYKHKTGTAY